MMHQFADQADAILKGILDQSVECIKLVSTAGEVEFVNPNGLLALAISDYADIAGQPWAELWPEVARDRVRQAVERANRGQRDRFEGYCPNARGEPRWWDVSVSPVRDAGGRITHILATSRDITSAMQERMTERMLREEAQQAAERAENIAREMRHRLKNQLAVISAVSRLIGRHAESVADMGERIDTKLTALSRAQDLLMIHRDRPPQAKQAIGDVLDASGAGEKVRVRPMPAVTLGDDSIQQLALILGELQTNSLKYGALGSEAGTVDLSGEFADRILTLTWDEDCGRPVDPPSHRGLGHVLIERMGSAASARGQIEWRPRGPRVVFHLRAN